MIKKPFIFATLLFISIIAQGNSQKELFINYGVAQEGTQLFKYFHNLKDGFYVDIGSYDAIYASNTLNLYTMGWEGINIDASPDRLPRFFQLRKGQTNINYAIGSENQIVTLYELGQDSSSTVSEKVKDYLKGQKDVRKQVKVPSISLKSLCQRFFYRKPIFMNLDIQGYGSKALQSNDWNNPHCVPQIIFSEINTETHQSGLPLPQTILTKLGYIKEPREIGLNQIYIHQSVAQKYKKNYQEGTKIMAEKQITNIYPISSWFTSLNLSTSLYTHYIPQTDQIYFHFARINEPINILKINLFSNQISDKKNRPIVILNFSPSSSYLILPHSNYQSQTITMSNRVFTHLKTKNNEGSEIHAYILDHKEKNSGKPKILITNTIHKHIPSKSQNITFEKILTEIKSLDLSIKKSSESLNNIQNQVKSSFGQTQQRLSKAKQIIKSFQNFQTKKFQSDTNINQQQEKYIITKISQISRSQILLFILTFIIFSTTIFIICLSSEQAKQNRKLAQVYHQQIQNQSSYIQSTPQINTINQGQQQTEQ